MPSFGMRFRRAGIALAATAALGVGVITGLGPVPGSASSHREAPLVAADPQVDGTDLYAFVSPDKPNTSTIVSNWIPFEEPAGGPNFYSFAPGVYYDIYRWIFKNHYVSTDTFLYNTGVVHHLTDATLNFYQTYTLTRIGRSDRKVLVRNARVAPSDVGDTSMPDYPQLSDEAIQSFGKHGKTWTGQADDSFFLDLRVFDLAYGAPNFNEIGDDTLKGFNVNSFVIQVPNSELTRGGDGSGIVGIWTTAERQSIRTQTSKGDVRFSGRYVQVSRLGMPLVNEVVVPVGSKDLFNGSNPLDDAQFLPKVVDPELPHDLNALYGLPIPDCNPNMPGIQRDCDLVPLFLQGLPGLNQPPSVRPSEMLRLNTTIPPCEQGSCKDYSRLGVIGGDNAGFPNGRRLADDIIDVSLQVVEGCLINHNCGPGGLGDGVDHNDVSFLSSFPYLAYPHSGSDANPHSQIHRQ